VFEIGLIYAHRKGNFARKGIRKIEIRGEVQFIADASGAL
jgi:hypothetical protein